MKKVIVERHQKCSNEFLVKLVSNKERERWIIFTYWHNTMPRENLNAQWYFLTHPASAAMFLAERFKCAGYCYDERFERMDCCGNWTVPK